MSKLLIYMDQKRHTQPHMCLVCTTPAPPPFTCHGHVVPHGGLCALWCLLGLPARLGCTVIHQPPMFFSMSCDGHCSGTLLDTSGYDWNTNCSQLAASLLCCCLCDTCYPPWSAQWQSPLDCAHLPRQGLYLFTIPSLSSLCRSVLFLMEEFIYENAPRDSLPWFFTLDLLYSHLLLLPHVPLHCQDVEIWLDCHVELEVGLFYFGSFQAHCCF